ncbi:charged multivesicular body protein 4b-like [Aplysia californica]|uniref:Charged multivesicular body protein 4b-like n=1 Tax=Aplysia californica TaxID=6500 RepID=A0ABM1VZJ5_APLCA|nr:charged multivesicular body protein 4b-like [Aplysia californica]
MSLLKKLFGGGKQGKAPTPQEGIQRLREVEEMLMKKSDFLEKKIDVEIATAKKNGIKNKRLAIQALKRKKNCEKQLNQIDGTLSTIEFQRQALENASTNTEVLKVMGVAARALKEAYNNMDIDKVNEIMDEIAEQQEQANEITEVIANPAGFGMDIYSEDDLLAELEEMEQEDLDQTLMFVGPTEDLPSVPSAEPTEPRPAAKPRPTKNDDDLRELEMWAS